MSITTANNNLIKPAFQIQGTLFTLYILNILTTDIEQLLTQLIEFISQSPKFFHRAPLILACHQVDLTDVQFIQLLAELKRLNLMPIGLKNDFPHAERYSVAHQLALFPAQKLKGRELNDEIRPSNDTSAVTPHVDVSEGAGASGHSMHTALFIHQPVRSGNQIYAQGRDLVVHGSVSYGAELLADGHIHVYGPMRGRALAGVNGNTEARIYCHSLEAELLSIAGHYWLSDDLKKAHKKSVCVSFREGQLAIETMS